MNSIYFTEVFISHIEEQKPVEDFTYRTIDIIIAEKFSQLLKYLAQTTHLRPNASLHLFLFLKKSKSPLHLFKEKIFYISGDVN